MRETLEQFLACLYQERFFEAHEVLESLWFPRRFELCDEIKLLKGFINAAVSFELLKKERPKAAQKVWQNYLKYKPLISSINSEYKEDFYKLSWHVEKIHAMKNSLVSHEARL
ncbi:MAG: DUF309 domain-containing protein [Sulfurimonadaceae bacterium]|jgi:hypothetical protein|nr:DUF309 domain-containing protein [Sulfurimonadaceae bacterium]